MMSYEENRENKQFMVKVNLCTECAVKLNYKKFKDRVEKKRRKKEKKDKKKKKKKRREEKKESSSES